MKTDSMDEIRELVELYCIYLDKLIAVTRMNMELISVLQQTTPRLSSDDKDGILQQCRGETVHAFERVTLLSATLRQMTKEMRVND